MGLGQGGCDPEMAERALQDAQAVIEQANADIRLAVRAGGMPGLASEGEERPGS